MADTVRRDKVADTVNALEMESDPALARACALTAIALMGFTSVPAFHAFASADPETFAESPTLWARVRIVQRWLAEPVGVNAADAGGAWSEDTSAVRAWETAHLPETRAFAALTPFLDVDSAALGVRTEPLVELVSSTMVSSTIPPQSGRNPSVDDALRTMLQSAKRHGVDPHDFAGLIRTIVAPIVAPNAPETTNFTTSVRDRLGAAIAAGAMHQHAISVADNPDAVLAALERPESADPVANLTRDAWTRWLGDHNAITAAARNASRALGVGLDVRAAVAVLASLRDKRISRADAASDAYLAWMQTCLEGLCATVTARDGVASVHRHLHARIGTPPANAPEPLRRYVANVAAMDLDQYAVDSMSAVSEAFADVFGDPAIASALRSAIVGVDTRAISSLGVPAVVAEVERAYSADDATCASKRATLNKARLVMHVAARGGLSDAAPPRTADALHAHLHAGMLAILNESLEARYGPSVPPAARAARETDLQACFDKSLARGSMDPSLRACHAYVEDATDVVDEVHVVRVVIAMRTAGFAAAAAPTAEATALALIDDEAANAQQWSGRLHTLQVGRVDTSRQQAGPFYLVTVNGAQVREIVGRNMRSLLRSIASADNDPRAAGKLNYVYSAYGLSGAGKTRALLNGPGSVLGSVVETLAGPDGVIRGGDFQLQVGVTDIYGEIADGDGAGGACAGTDLSGDRCHIVRYTTHALRKARTDSSAPIAELGADDVDVIVTDQSMARLSVPSVPLVPSPHALDDHIFTDVEPAELAYLQTQVSALTNSKKLTDFAQLRGALTAEGHTATGHAAAGHPILHVRPTPNNVESSRAHTAICVRVVRSATHTEVARVTLLDMAGAEDVDAIQGAYFADVEIGVVQMQGVEGLSLGDFESHEPNAQVKLSLSRPRPHDADEVLARIRAELEGDAVKPPLLRDTGQWLTNYQIGPRARALAHTIKHALRTERDTIRRATYRMDAWVGLLAADHVCPRARQYVYDVLQCTPSCPAVAEAGRALANLRHAHALLGGYVEQLAVFGDTAPHTHRPVGKVAPRPGFKLVQWSPAQWATWRRVLSKSDGICRLLWSMVRDERNEQRIHERLGNAVHALREGFVDVHAHLAPEIDTMRAMYDAVKTGMEAEERLLPPNVRARHDAAGWIAGIKFADELPYAVFMTHYANYAVAYEASVAARNALQCPLRYQGNFITKTIGDVRDFATALGSSDRAGAERRVQGAWLRWALGDVACDVKFCQIVSVRTDFPLASDPTAPPGEPDDAALARQSGLVQSLQFASALNPLRLKS